MGVSLDSLIGLDASPFNRMQNLGRYFYQSIFPEVAIIERQAPMQDEEGSEWNSIIQSTGIIVGGQDSGKTAFANRVAQGAIAKYGEEQVQCLRVDGHIGHIRGHVEPALVHIICVEDITETTQTDTDIRNFFGIRHVIRRATDERVGLVIIMCTAHRYYSIPLSFRVDTDFQCFKSVPTNTFDKRELLKEFGSTAYQFLERVRRLRLEVPQVKGYNVLRIFGKSGYMYNQFVGGEVFVDVPPPPYEQR